VRGLSLRTSAAETPHSFPSPPVRQNGWTGLKLAAGSGHREAVKVLLEAKANVNAADKVRRGGLAIIT
jgi:ankyrin repeat protein